LTPPGISHCRVKLFAERLRLPANSGLRYLEEAQRVASEALEPLSARAYSEVRSEFWKLQD
jgi:hypothetical protein